MEDELLRVIERHEQAWTAMFNILTEEFGGDQVKADMLITSALMSVYEEPDCESGGCGGCTGDCADCPNRQ